MRNFIRRLKAARRAWKGDSELNDRALSFACAALSHLETQPTWSEHTVRMIAYEAVQRQLGAVDEGRFSRTTDAVWLANITPSPKEQS